MNNVIFYIYRFIFCRKIFYKLNLHIFKISLRSLGILNSESPEATGEDRFLSKLSELWKPKVIFDVGSNTDAFGYQYFKKSTIYSIEPHPETYKKLKIKFSKIKRIKKINLAISDKNTTSYLWDFADDAELKNTQPTSQLSSLNKEVITNIHKQKAKKFKVKVMTLEKLTEKLKVDHIDFLKIDTEGNELKVLKGCKKLIENNNIKVIQFEFNEMNAITRTFFYDFVKILKNYEFYRILPNSLLHLKEYRPLTHEIFGFQNIVAINKQEKKLIEFLQNE